MRARKNRNEQRAREAIVAVLAGGRASRLGGAKATAELAGRPLIEYPLSAADQAGLATIVVAKADSPLPPIDREIVIEPDLPRHPLAGVVAALEVGRDRPVLVLGCDLPLIGPELLRWLAGQSGPVVVPLAEGHLQPLAALYRPEILPALRAGLEAAVSLKDLVVSLDPRIVGEEELAPFGDPAEMFANVNTPEDLRRVTALLGG
ncbi:MAG: molybdenum cofactor guanylyltransferase [Thermoleophilia bacterium]|nr:molybdenum cofactor guanylyltransferase [Thermoleophilia bacterium]